MSFEVAPAAYASFMGRFSEPLALEFVDAAGVEPGQRAIDVGCGPGALTDVLVERLGAGQIAAVDPSEPFVAYAASRLTGVDVRRATAEDLPYPDAAFDIALAQLVVHFMADPVAGLREMGRVTKPGGVVAACVWDHAGGGGPLATFWTAVRDTDGEAEDESGLAGVREGHLGELARAAGLADIEESRLAVGVDYRASRSGGRRTPSGSGRPARTSAGWTSRAGRHCATGAPSCCPTHRSRCRRPPGACGRESAEPTVQRGGAVEPRTTSESGSCTDRAGRLGSAMASSRRRAASAPIWWCGIAIVVSGGRSLSRKGMSLKPTTLMSSGQVMSRSANTS